MALVILVVCEVHDASFATIRAISTLVVLTPTDSPQVVDSVLLCRESLKEVKKAIESLCFAGHAHYITQEAGSHKYIMSKILYIPSKNSYVKDILHFGGLQDDTY